MSVTAARRRDLQHHHHHHHRRRMQRADDNNNRGRYGAGGMIFPIGPEYEFVYLRLLCDTRSHRGDCSLQFATAVRVTARRLEVFVGVHHCSLSLRLGAYPRP